MTGPYARAAGNYTRYGDVFDLLKKSDDRFVVFSSGEGMTLDFDPRKLPPLPAGWIRDYFFYADGFEKDLDFYAAHAFTVEPLPHHGSIAYPYPAGKDYPADPAHLNTNSTSTPANAATISPPRSAINTRLIAIRKPRRDERKISEYSANAKNVSSRPKRPGFFLLVRSCERAASRSGGISLRSIALAK